MAVIDRLDHLQRRHHWLGLPIAVVYKYADDNGGSLAALITYYGFLSLFPLILLGVTLLGFVLQHDPSVRARILHSAFSDFPIVGQQLAHIKSFNGSGFAVVVGLLGSVYGGLGVANAGQNAMNQIWGVPRNQRPNPIKARGRSLVLLVLLGSGVLLTTALSGVSTSAAAYAHSLVDLGGLARAVAIAASVVLNIALFITAFRLLTVARLSIRDVAAGAVVAAILWQVLQAVGTYYLAHKLKGATAVYGTFGLVLGLIAWIYVEAVIVVLCNELNAVLRQGLWPRALLTPFTDNVVLTDADQQVYETLATAQQTKGFEQVDVSFDPPADDGSTPP
jgi:YihY family inner membrane protein